MSKYAYLGLLGRYEKDDPISTISSHRLPFSKLTNLYRDVRFSSANNGYPK